MAWTTLTLQVTTPLFNGGADPDGSAGFGPDQEAGIRVASIRGAMRFWFRALAGSLTGPDLRLLAALERRVFGGAAGQAEAGEGSAPSPVQLRIPVQPSVVPAAGPHSFLPELPRHELRRHESRWILYLMGQSLGNLAEFVIKRPYVAPGQQFQLKVGFRHSSGADAGARTAVEWLAFASLWLTCTYGGIGARTRRGFGGLRIVGTEGDLPGTWRGADVLVTPGLDHYERLTSISPDGPLAPYLSSIQALLPDRTFDPASAWAQNAPSFPVLGTAYTRAGASKREFRNWVQALSYAGEELRHFRADEPNPGAQYRPPVETREWSRVVHGNSDRFPLGALGLPVVYRDGYVVNADRGHGSEPPLRRASPLWLRPVGQGQQWRLLSLAFQTDFLPGPAAPAVHLWRHGAQGRQLHVTNDDLKVGTGDWVEAISAGESFIP